MNSKKILISMSDNRGLSNILNNSNYNSLVAAINYSYSKKMNYDFLYLRPGLKNEYPINNCFSSKNELRYCAWSKLLSSIKIIDEYPQYDYVVYIDSDCIFYDINLSISNYLANSKVVNGVSIAEATLIFLNDKPWSSVLPCSGFYIFKNNSSSREMFKTWFETDNPRNNLLHNWEQNSLYINLNNFINKISVIDDWMFEEYPSQFLRHIGSGHSEDRVPFFNQVIKNIGIENDYHNIIEHLINNSLITYNTNEYYP
jgi:hypothetical protein